MPVGNKFRIAVIGSTRGTSMGSVEEKNTLVGNGMVDLVISNKPLAPNTILQRAQSAGIPYIHIPNISKSQQRTAKDFARDLAIVLSEEQIDFVVMVGFMLVLPKEFMQHWQGRIINVHPSLLPEFGGGMDLDVHKLVIEAGKMQSGCTVHFATEVVDGGPRIIQLRCEIDRDETPDCLKAKVQALEKTALVQAVLACEYEPDLFARLARMEAALEPRPASLNWMFSRQIALPDPKTCVRAAALLATLGVGLSIGNKLANRMQG